MMIGGVPAWQVTLGYSMAIAVMGFGVWLLRAPLPEEGEASGKAINRNDPNPEPGGTIDSGGPIETLVRWRKGLTVPTRLVLGFVLLLVGYHIAAYSGPAHYLTFRVPRDRWWMLVSGVIIAVLGSMGVDWFERRTDDRSAG